MNASQAANKVFTKLENSTVQMMRIAVFVKGEDIQMTKPTSQLFIDALKFRPHDFVGVYDQNAHESWINEDLIYCGMKP